MFVGLTSATEQRRHSSFLLNPSALREPLEEWPNNPLQYSCLKNPHGQRSLMGYIPEAHKEPDMTVRISRPETKIYFYKILENLEIWRCALERAF